MFRSGEPVTPPDTYAEGKADGGKDIFVEVYEQGLNVSFVQPETDCLVQPGTEVDFVVNASMEADLQLLVNGAGQPHFRHGGRLHGSGAGHSRE